MSQQPKLTERTKRGLVIWSILAFGIVITPRIIRTWFPGKPIKIEIKTLEKIAHFKQSERKTHRYYARNRYCTPPCKFNPNEYTLNQWMALGLTQKQAEVVLKFCKYPLRSNDDLKRIFVIPEALFFRIKDSTIYPQNVPVTNVKADIKTLPNKRFLKIKVSSMDSSSLVTIKGIGPFYAKMIMRYERALGGFIKKEQLLEVYKMNPETYEILCNKLDFSETQIRKISINKANIEALEKHPYLNRWQANSIVKIRLQLGGYQSIQELRKSHLINAEDFEKLEPYVSL
ncbi:MAG: ComEA family DNA-binding protein [Flavobacteriales bacterium]